MSEICRGKKRWLIKPVHGLRKPRGSSTFNNSLFIFFLIQLLVEANIHTSQSESLLCFSRIISLTGEKQAWFTANIT